MGSNSAGVGSYAGIWRGIVEDNVDPESRKRFKVRVLNVHRDEVQVAALPWAELAVFGGKGFGDLPHYDVGDAVFVMFERGDRRFPVILGGWLSYVGGTPDLPSEQTGDYASQQKVWVRVDRFGNKLTMNPDEGWIEMSSTDSRVRVHGDEGTVTIESDAKVKVLSPNVEVSGAEIVTVEANKVFAEVANEVSVICDDTVNIRAAETVNIGRYEDEVSGPLNPKLTNAVNVQAEDVVKIEQTVDGGTGLDVDIAGVADMAVIGNINIVGQAALSITVETDSSLTVNSGSLTVQAQAVNLESTDSTPMTITSSENLSIDVQNAAAVTVGGNATVDISGSADISVAAGATLDVGASADITVGVNATVNASGAISLQSSSRLEMSAPVIDIEASGTLSLNGSGVTTIDGGLILIG